MARTNEVDLSVQIEAKMDRLEKQMARADAVAAKGFKSMQRNAEQASQRMEASMAKASSGIASKLSGLGKGLAFGALGAIGAQGAADIARFAGQFRDLQNALKVTGLEGKALEDVFRSLSRIAFDQGTPLDALVTLYSRAAQSSKELNASQADLLRFSDGVAVALRVAGTSATEAQGALLQLGQALGSGKVAAEEFNSVNEGARPILQAVANGLKEAGGSVSKLKAIVNDGKLSSEAFFRACPAGSDGLREQAAKAVGTVGQSLNRMGTAMLLLVGHLDEVSGASTNATKNLDGVAKVIENLPGYIDAAIAGLKSLEGYLDRMGNASIFKKLNDALGYSDPDFLRSQGMTPPSDMANGRVAGAFETTAGTGIAEAGKSSRVLSDGAKKATVSLEDFAVKTDAAAAKSAATSFPTGGAISDYVANVVSAESGGKVDAKNPNSTATGLGQFIESTWLDLFRKNFPDRAASMSTSTILALRKDAEISRTLIEAYAQENANVLRSAGVAVNEGALHLAHFLGAGDAAKVLSAAPGTPLAGLISSASIKANPTILGGGRTVDDARAYAERRAGNTRKAAGNFTPAETAAQDRAAGYQDIVAGSVEYIATTQAEAAAIGMTAQAASKLRFEQDLLNDASRAGIEITPELRAQFSQLASGMAEVEAATKKAGDAQSQMQATQTFLKGQVSGFFSDIITGSMSVEDALNRVLSSLADAAIQAALFGEGPLGNLFGGGILSSIFGFAKGGIAANGRPQPLPTFAKGGVSRSAAIFGEAGPEAAVPLPDGRSIPVTLDMARMPQGAGSGGGVVQNVTVAPPINIPTPQGGDAKQNDDLARKTSAAVEKSVRSMVQDELRSMRRQGMR